jgi:hypothetical protein
MNRRRRRRLAGAMTVSSKPTIGVGPTRSGSSTSGSPCSITAAHTVDHDTPKRRAIDAGVASNTHWRPAQDLGLSVRAAHLGPHSVPQLLCEVDGEFCRDTWLEMSLR